MHSSIITCYTLFGKSLVKDCHKISPVTSYLNLIFSRDFTPGIIPICLIYPDKIQSENLKTLKFLSELNSDWFVQSV